MKSSESSVCLERIFVAMALMLILFVSTAHAEVASVYGGRDGYCGKSHSQWRTSKLLSDDSGSSPIAIWRAGSRLSQ